MQLDVFYSWQSDLPETKKYISNCLNNIAKEQFGEHSIRISRDARNSNGSVNLAETLFRKISQSVIFVADLSIINAEFKGRKCCNPNVLLELGYAINNLGIENILILFDSKYGNVEDLPFDIRQNKIIKFNSENNNKFLKNTLKAEISQILSNINPTIYDYLYSEINNRIISHLMEFTKIFYYESECKNRYDYTYFITKNEDEIITDIVDNTFLGFDLFNNLSLLENEFELFLNQKTNGFFISDNTNRILSKIVLSMKSISKFLNYDPFFSQVGVLGNEFDIISAKSFNQFNEDKLVLLKRSGNPLNNNGVIISANFITMNKVQAIRGIYKCVNPEYFVKVIKNYINAIIDWSKYTNDTRLKQLAEIKSNNQK
ncbi:MAG: hypothetical protein J1F33_04570 [Clostridiales bacterium]|nr:hypothetical protein [Clostridiales bacterium]